MEKPITNKIRVWHIPQVPMKAFKVEVENEREAALLISVLSMQHLWLFENDVIPDYSNAMGVEMFEDNEWVEYYNEKEGMDWDEIENEYFPYLVADIRKLNL